jgi:D-glycero-D-manno-heptose 1,7-bisphosphate phosphatase
VSDIVSRSEAIEFEDAVRAPSLVSHFRMLPGTLISSPSHPPPRVGRKALFLDRDGTVIVHVPYLYRPEEVVVIPGVPEALGRARAAGFRIYLFTNQSGVGRGRFSLEDVHAVNRRMIERIGLGEGVFDGICIAPEAPGQPSPYRKPSPRYILETCAAEGLDPGTCWMIGDSPADWEAGLAAGIRSAAVGVGADEPADVRAKREALGVPEFPDLPAAIAFALR